MSTKVNEFYGMDTGMQQAADMPMASADAIAAAMSQAVAAPAAVAVPKMNVSVYYRDIYTTPESFDQQCDQFKLDISFIVTVSEENGNTLESGVVTKRLILDKQCLAQELACNTPVTEEFDLTKKVVQAAKEVKEQVTESVDKSSASIKRMRELAGIPHHTNRV